MAAYAQMEGRVSVVTRNVHTDDIRAFLDAKGLSSVSVDRISRPHSKADIVCDPHWTAGAADGARVLFVDDTISEHLDEQMREATHVVCFLFARAV